MTNKLKIISSSNSNFQFTYEMSPRSYLILEAFTIYRYLLGAMPSMALVRKYVRCVEHLRSGVPLKIPNLFIAFPHMLYLVDRANLDKKVFEGEFFWRINSASFICESSIYGSKIYLGADQKNDLIHSLCGLFTAGLFEIMARISCGLFSWPFRLFLALRK